MFFEVERDDGVREFIVESSDIKESMMEPGLPKLYDCNTDGERVSNVTSTPNNDGTFTVEVSYS